MPIARFINDTATIEVNGKTETASVGVKSNIVSASVGATTYPQALSHNKLSDRDLPNQHPIEAITGLQDVLDRLWTFTFEQSSASDSWEIEHNLGRNPSVVIVDSSGNVFYPAVQYINENKIVVTMNGATTGKAYLN